MVVKTTLRLPEPVARKLRDRSKVEGRSLNETAVRAIQQGLGDEVKEDEWWRELGDLVIRPPKKGAFNLEAMRRRRRKLGISFTPGDVRDAMEEFDRSRDDRG